MAYSECLPTRLNPLAKRTCFSQVGSFTNIRGGHNFPWLIRNTPRKPIRVFLQVQGSVALSF
jgi:hypothetical protein